jgi:hypothetical protein
VSTVLAHFVEKLSGNELQMLASKKSGILDRLNLGSGLAFAGVVSRRRCKGWLSNGSWHRTSQ